MTTRTTDKSVKFIRPFAFGDADGSYPAGEYLVQTDEEIIEGPSFVAWRRVATKIHLRREGRTQVHAIEPAELDLLLSKDADAASTR
jgi:hypothetical protein